MSTTSTDRRHRAARRTRGLLLLGLVGLVGCAAGPAPAHPAAAAAAHPAPAADAVDDKASSPYRDLDTVAAGTIVHVPTGLDEPFDRMMDVLADARVIYVGEMHNNLSDHEAQLAILKDLERRHPGRVMVGMEMFATDAQADLDAWLAGSMDREAFLKLWYKNWSEYYGYYADILQFVHDHHIPLIALNATPEQVHAVSQGTESLPPDWDLKDPYSRAYLDAVLGGHGHGAPEHFYEVQVLWEETMAQSAYAALTSAAGKDRQLLVLAGGGHVRFGFGVPRRLFRRLPTSYATVVLEVQSLPEGRPDLQMDVDVPHFPLPVGDFVWFDRFKDLDDTRVKLGVRIQPDVGGMRVLDVVPGTAAEAAGLRKDDLLLSLDGRPLDGMVSVQVALTLAEAGGSGTLVVQRGGQRVSLTVPYRAGGRMPKGS